MKINIEKTLKKLSENGIKTEEIWFKEWFSKLDYYRKDKQVEIICRNYQVNPEYYEKL